jgi:glycosyltransferase involved in cell wall biosynthesis
MKSHPKVSVIVPTYGHGHYILQTLNTVFDQTFRDFEVIVVNDGSPDDTEVVLQDLIKLKRIRYVWQSNQGVAAARNHGISLARGEYVAFLDDDDCWPDDKLEWQVAALEEGDIVAIGGTAIFLRGGERVVESEADGTEKMIRYAELFNGCPFVSPGLVMIRKDALDRTGGFDPDIWGADDHDLWFGLAAEGNLVKQARPSLIYRCHDSNASLDSLRMLMNSKKVVDKRLKGISGSGREQYKRMGYHYLFRWRGALCLREAVGGLLRFPPQIGMVWRNIKGIVLCFGGSMLEDATIRSLFWQELKSGAKELPERLRERLAGAGREGTTVRCDQ